MRAFNRLLLAGTSPLAILIAAFLIFAGYVAGSYILGVGIWTALGKAIPTHVPQKAALAMLIWGGRVRVISTHNGVENPFNELVEDIRAGKRKGTVHRVTFQEAVADGLYRRVCLRLGKEWTAAEEAAWMADVYAFYGDGAEEELDCVPANSGGAWLSRALIESRMSADTPVLRWECKAGFELLPDHIRAAECRDWLEAVLAPLLAALPADAISFNGEDFGRSGDLTVHVPLTPDTKELICAESIAKMKDTVRVMNFARGDLANADDVVEALEEGKMAAYVTDFPSAKLIDVDGVIAIPHLGASTPESEENCASMGAEELIDFLEHGNIQNSVNLPTVRMDPNGAARMTVVHKNQPNMIATITDTISKDGMNIAAFTDKNRGEIAYSIIDTDTAYSASVVADIEKIDGVIRVRVIQD